MLMQRIKISNYKTYLSLDLDLTVDDDRPIILIGGANGGGKTTLFEAISGALYGLKIENKEHFEELLNQGAVGKVKPEISLQITFVGKVLGQQQKYILKRIYQLNPQGYPLESVSLNMNGNVYVYGTMTPIKDRMKAEQEINKIIKANLPQELSQYFLFDAMQSSELLKKNVFAQTIRDNFENVLGFKKYLQLKRAAEKLQQEWAQQRLEAEKEAKEYNELCGQKDKLVADLNACLAEQDKLYKFMSSVEDEYRRAKEGAQQTAALNKKIQELTSSAIKYFASCDFKTLIKEAQNTTHEDIYEIARQKYPLAWKILKEIAFLNEIEYDFKKAESSRKNEQENEQTLRKIREKTVVCDGYTLDFDEYLQEVLGDVIAGKSDAFYVDSFKMLSRNFEKILHVIQIILEHDKAFVTCNYYISNGHLEKRKKILKAAHTSEDAFKNSQMLKMAPPGIREILSV